MFRGNDYSNGNKVVYNKAKGNNNVEKTSGTVKRKKRKGRVWPEKEVLIKRALVVTEDPEGFKRDLNELLREFDIEKPVKKGGKGRIWPEKHITIHAVSKTRSPKRISEQINKILKENSVEEDYNVEVKVEDI